MMNSENIQQLNSKENADCGASSLHLQQTPCYMQPGLSLYNEDCLQTMQRIEKESIDLILQDPPYGYLSCEWDKSINVAEMWLHWERIIKPNGAIIMTAREPFTSILVTSRIGFYKHKWVWNKIQSGSFQNAKYMPLQIEEDVLVFAKGTVNYYPIMRKGKLRKKGGDKNNKEQFAGLKGGYSIINDDYHPVNILEYPNCSNKAENIHPTQKPIDLFRYLIKTYTRENETVFDGYSGSGTTAAACLKENRRFIGSELNKEYYELSIKRLENIRMKPELWSGCM